MVAVITELGSNKRDNEDTAGHSYSESGDVDESISLGEGQNFLPADYWTILFGHYFHHDFVRQVCSQTIRE